MSHDFEPSERDDEPTGSLAAGLRGWPASGSSIPAAEAYPYRSLGLYPVPTECEFKKIVCR
jgi:hypothetical protein